MPVAQHCRADAFCKGTQYYRRFKTLFTRRGTNLPPLFGTRRADSDLFPVLYKVLFDMKNDLNDPKS
jgi:hypothetical protein